MNRDSNFGPWSDDTRITIFLLCGTATEKEIEATLNSLFSSSIQNLRILCVGINSDVQKTVSAWTSSDSRVEYAPQLPDKLPDTGSILVIRCGCLLTKYTLEALREVLRLSDVKVVRTVVDGVAGTLEFWDAEWLAEKEPRAMAEADSRRLGLERWISAEGAGLHAYGALEPKVFFRRGAANRHVLEVVAFDARSRSFLEKKDQKINELRSEVKFLRRILDSESNSGPSKLRRTLWNFRNKVISRR